MKQRYIPMEKRSKREQREYHAAQRGSWGGIDPVTRKPPNPKAYNRKKSGQRYEHEPLPGFLFCLALVFIAKEYLLPTRGRRAHLAQTSKCGLMTKYGSIHSFLGTCVKRTVPMTQSVIIRFLFIAKHKLMRIAAFCCILEEKRLPIEFRSAKAADNIEIAFDTDIQPVPAPLHRDKADVVRLKSVAINSDTDI